MLARHARQVCGTTAETHPDLGVFWVLGPRLTPTRASPTLLRRFEPEWHRSEHEQWVTGAVRARMLPYSRPGRSFSAATPSPSELCLWLVRAWRDPTWHHLLSSRLQQKGEKPAHLAKRSKETAQGSSFRTSNETPDKTKGLSLGCTCHRPKRCHSGSLWRRLGLKTQHSSLQGARQPSAWKSSSKTLGARFALDPQEGGEGLATQKGVYALLSSRVPHGSCKGEILKLHGHAKC